MKRQGYPSGSFHWACLQKKSEATPKHVQRDDDLYLSEHVLFSSENALRGKLEAWEGPPQSRDDVSAERNGTVGLFDDFRRG